LTKRQLAGAAAYAAAEGRRQLLLLLAAAGYSLIVFSPRHVATPAALIAGMLLLPCQ